MHVGKQDTRAGTQDEVTRSTHVEVVREGPIYKHNRLEK